MTALLAWALANPELTAAAVGGLLSVLSAVLEQLGWTKVSKVLGTITLDGGRMVRYAKALRDATSRPD